MRKNLSRIFVAVAAMAWMTISAQSQVIQPEVISNFDNEKLVMNALEGEKQGGMSMNAVWVNKQIDMSTMGTWNTMLTEVAVGFILFKVQELWLWVLFLATIICQKERSCIFILPISLG
jgi:hypothetical protein